MGIKEKICESDQNLAFCQSQYVSNDRNPVLFLRMYGAAYHACELIKEGLRDETMKEERDILIGKLSTLEIGITQMEEDAARKAAARDED